jgi:DNA modification methylase
MLARHELPDGLLLQGHVLEALASLPAKSVHLVVTSPPYFALRKYEGDQATEWSDGRWAYGWEDTPERWADHTMEWLRAVRRVLRDDGLVFLNVGSRYATGSSGMNGDSRYGSTLGGAKPSSGNWGALRHRPRLQGYKALDLIDPYPLLYPRLLADGWYVRSVIAWAKENALPESVRGIRWEKHRVKVGTANVGLPATLEDGGPSRTTAGLRQLRTGIRDAIWADCPGCPECAPNDGLVLRRGAWRPTDSYEWVLMLAKSATYWADGEGVREGIAPSTRTRVSLAASRDPEGRNTLQGGYKHSSEARVRRDVFPDGRDHLVVPPNPSGRNLRNVWAFPAEPLTWMVCGHCYEVYDQRRFKRLRLIRAVDEEGEERAYQACAQCGETVTFSHYATFPSELVRRCVLIGTSEAGCCAVCGAQWARVLRRGELQEHPERRHRNVRNVGDFDGEDYPKRESTLGLVQNIETIGFRPTCSHGGSPVPSTVLDPFMGSGTTALVARSLGRRFIGIDLSPAYIAMTLARLETEQPTLGAGVGAP